MVLNMNNDYPEITWAHWKGLLRKILVLSAPLLIGLFVGFLAAEIESGRLRYLVFAIDRKIEPAQLPHVLSAIAWPAVCVFGVLILRRQIVKLLDRLQAARLAGNGMLFFPDYGRQAHPASSSADAVGKESALLPPTPTLTPTPTPTPTSSPAPSADASPRPRIDPRQVANIFWTGSDAMALFDHLLRHGERTRTVAMLRQLNHHIKESGLQGHDLQLRSERLLREANQSLQSDWGDDKRIATAQEVLAIMREFGNLVENLQPSFLAWARTD
jgi:hypothetical protein